jgi:hypothetical protein
VNFEKKMDEKDLIINQLRAQNRLLEEENRGLKYSLSLLKEVDNENKLLIDEIEQLEKKLETLEEQ